MQDSRRASHCPGKADWLSGPMIEPLNLPGNEAVGDLIDNVFARSGFNARRLARAAQLYATMLEKDATVCLTVAGAMTPIGMSGVFSSLIERGFVDIVISTGANLFHDLHRPFDMPMVQGTPEVDDNDLAETGVARIYDVFIADDETLTAADALVHRAYATVDGSGPYSTARLHHKLGQFVQQHAADPEKSFVASAAKYDVPIYTSSPGDSGIGMNLAVPQLLGQGVQLNPMLDVIETTAIVRDAAVNGVIEIGGGSPKNFYLQTQPMLQQVLFDDSKKGHDYCIQITTDSPHWGGLSGATPAEARSWGKTADARTNNVVVYSCASIVFPLMAQYVLSRVSPRRHRRLYQRLDELTEALRASARSCRRLREDYPDLFPDS